MIRAVKRNVEQDVFNRAAESSAVAGSVIDLPPQVLGAERRQDRTQLRRVSRGKQCGLFQREDGPDGHVRRSASETRQPHRFGAQHVRVDRQRSIIGAIRRSYRLERGGVCPLEMVDELPKVIRHSVQVCEQPLHDALGMDAIALFARERVVQPVGERERWNRGRSRQRHFAG